MITVVGMGPGNLKNLSYEAVEVIKTTTKVVAFGRISQTARQINPNVIEINRVDKLLEYVNQDREIAILASGDPCFFGVLEYLKNKNITVKRVIPGISSFQYLMAKLQKAWNEAVFVSFHGRDGDVDKILRNKLSVILTDSINSPNTISALLGEKGMRGDITVGFNLSHDNEVIFHKRVGDHICDISPLAVVVVENEMD